MLVLIGDLEHFFFFLTKDSEHLLSQISTEQGLTERLFMRRYSTSSTVSFVWSAMIISGIVLSSDGRLQETTSIFEFGNM